MKRISLHILVVLAVLFSASLLLAQSQARIVRLSMVDGSVELDRAAGQGFGRAIQNMPITQGMRLRTGSGSNAEVEFENGSSLRLIGNTSVSFGRLSLGSDGAKLTAVNVEEGTAYFNIKKQSRDDFAVSFAGRELRMTDSSHVRVDVSESSAEVAMFKGEAELAGDQNVRLKKDETLSFDRGGDAQIAQSDVSNGVTEEPSDDWDQQRADDLAKYERQQQQLTSSPYDYGMSDLGQYGNYYNDASYGWVWRPYGMSYAWDPFNNGGWFWYPGFGYTWVSSYPWGWTPFRYGRWVFIPSYGWAWQPGYWNNWWTGPVIVNAPATFIVPRPPHYRDHHVAWVGTPPNNWTGPHHDWDRDHDRGHDRDRVHVRAQDRDTAGTRQTVTMNAPTSMNAPGAKTQTPAVPASGFTGNGGDKMIVTTPVDRNVLHVDGGGNPRDVVRVPHGRDHNVQGNAIAGSTGATPQATPGQPRVDSHHTPQPHVDSATPHAGTPHVSPPPRVETPHAAPHVEAPHSAPHLEAPHMSVPHSGGGEAHPSGGGHSPK
jgi:hypothetical protein